MAQKTNTTLLWVIIGVLVVLGAVYFYQSPQGQDEGADSVELGVITPLTGDAAVYGTAMQRAYDLAVEEVNAAGGVNGRDIELVYEDGKCEGTEATTAAQKLINIDQVPAILGGTCSGETLAAAELTQAAGVLLISPSATSPDISDAGDLVYRTYPSDALEANLMANHAVENELAATAAVISENTDFAQALHKEFVEAFIRLDRNIVFDEAFNTGETDFRTLVTQIRGQNPDVVYVIPQSPASGELILKQMQQLGVDAQVFLANTMLDRDAIADAPSLYEGAVLSEVQLPEGHPPTEKLLRAYDEAYRGAPEFEGFTAAAYDSVMLIVEAMRNGAMTGEEIAAHLDRVDAWPGAIGEITFDGNGDALLDLTLIEAEDGQLVPVERNEE